MRSFFDAVHKNVEIEDYLCEIIDTDHFQRLRHLKQLGLGNYVYPSANHTRLSGSAAILPGKYA